MESLIFTILIFLMIGLLIGLPVGLSYLIYRFIKKKNFDKRIRLISLIPILIMGYFIFNALYPSDSFYKKDFEEVTSLTFPKNGIIKYKIASFPDHFGDYTSIALIKVEKAFYDELPEHLTNRGFIENSLRTSSREFEDMVQKIGDSKINREFILEEGGGIYYYVGFLDDNKSLIVQRTSW